MVKMNNKLRFKGLWSDDIGNPSLYYPPDPSDVYFQLHLNIINQSGKVSKFQVGVCTPKGMMSYALENGLSLISDRNLIVMSEYSFKTLEEALNGILLKCKSDNWDTSVLKLQRYFLWEHEYVINPA